jgi:hypothetical protein
LQRTEEELRERKRKARVTSRRMALPSLVMTMPPMGSRIIFNMERGPRVVRMMEATDLAAMMLA